VHGYRVAQPSGHPERGAVWLVTSVTAPTPGVYRVANIEIHYRSGARHRTVAGDSEACVLVAPPADVQRLTRELNAFRPHMTDLGSVSRLVAQYETCSDPTLAD
jgi:hypothetical protein